MRIINFSMNGHEHAAHANDLIRLASAAGHEVIRVEYTSVSYKGERDRELTGCTTLYLSEGGYGSVARYDARRYGRICGDDIDWPAIMSHVYAQTKGPFLREEDLSAESMLVQSLRGLAVRAEDILRAVPADLAIIQQGSEPVSRMLATKAAKFGLRCLFRESSFFPGFLLLDRTGPHFFPGASELSGPARADVAPEVRERRRRAGRAFRDRWIAGRHAKYGQNTNHAALRRLDEKLAGAGLRVLLPLQLPWDASVLGNLGSFESFASVVRSVASSLPQGARLILKRHPREDEGDERDDYSDLDAIVVEDVDVYDTLSRCDLVVTLSSNLGLEAAMAGVPVVTIGQPHYHGRGMTHEANPLSPDFADVLTRGVRPPADAVDEYVGFLVEEFLVPLDDPNRLNEHFAAARIPVADPAPFQSYYPGWVQERVELVRRYNAAPLANHSHDEILAALGLSSEAVSGEAPSRVALESGERQVPITWDTVETGHFARYALAAALARQLPEGGTFLDIACGTGYGAALLAREANWSGVAVDASSPAIQFASRHWQAPNIEYRRASFGAFMPSSAKTFDLICCFETIEHLRDARSAITALIRSLSPGGMLLLSSPNADHYPLTDNPFHIRHWQPDELVGLIRELDPGLSVEIAGQRNGLLQASTRNCRFFVVTAHKPGWPGKRLAEVLPFKAPAPPPRPMVFIEPGRFSWRSGTLVGQQLVIEGRPAGDSFFYGPYIELARGEYKATFLFSARFKNMHEGSAELFLDVAAGGDVLGGTPFLLRSGAAPQDEAVTIPFSYGGGGTIEFRCFDRSSDALEAFHFDGVRLERSEPHQ